jgi:hypothetical protein
MGLVHSGEAWILSILGWVWLTLQEVWGFNLLSAQVFYGMLILSTLNLAFQAFIPASNGPRSAYFATVLAFTISTLVNILDTFPSTHAFGFGSFSPPGNLTGCSYAKIQQTFLFNGSPLYLVPAGALLGFMIIHLMVAAANMLDTENRSVWPGPCWGLALCALLSFRLFTMFDGSIKAGVENQPLLYLHLFSKPVWQLSAVFLLAFEASLLLSGLEGVPLPQVVQRKFVRFFSVGFVGVFCGGACMVLAERGMLTTPTMLAILLPLLPAIAGTIEATRPEPGPQPPLGPSSYVQDAPSAPPAEQVMASTMSGRSVFNRPMSQAAKSNRYYIPVPVEMIAEKNKGI